MNFALWHRLRERKLVQWALAYMASVWLVLQVLDFLADTFGWPTVLLRMVTVLLGVGLLAVLVLAWFHGDRGEQRFGAVEAVLMGVLLVIGGASAAWVARDAPVVPASSSAAAPVLEQGSIAVLPFVNSSSDPEQEYFSDGLTEELLNALARLPELRVPARSSVFNFKGSKAPIDSVARALRVAHVLEGSVRKDGTIIRVTARLIRADSGYHVWSETYDRELKDIIAVQGEIARAIARKLQVRLGSPAGAPLGYAAAADPDAYDRYLQGRFYRQRLTGADGRRAVALLQEAVRIDPEFAAGWGELALAYAYLYSIFESQERDLAERGFLAAEKALSLDPKQPEAHMARGRLLWTAANGYPHESAVEEFRRAVAASPSADEPRFQLGQVYAHMGLLDQALTELRAASAISPVDSRPRLTIALTLLFQIKPEEALAAFRETPEEQNASFRASHIAWALFLLGRPEEAERTLERALASSPDDRNGNISAMQAVLAAAAGDRGRAEAKIAAAATRQRGSIHFHHVAYAIGTAYALLQDPEPALKWLRTAANEGFPCYPLFARDPALDGLRSDPRFVALLGALRTQWEQYRTRFAARVATRAVSP